ncbi:MAG: alpha/beta hydrolase [Solirubrobacterales bacterium]|nr:alpha/beta hydrolase [Solirubrobacterales bacterium]
MGLHPQARALLVQVEESGLPPLNELSPADARLQAAPLIELVGPGPEVAHVEEFALPTRAGDMAARRYSPWDPAATILWVHGGGWVICDLESHDAMCRRLALESGCQVIAFDYRRAPEHPFPAPLEDSWDALQWVDQTCGGRPLILGGDSAGGNMAAVLALRARDRGGPPLVLQVLVYPVTDHVFTTASYAEHGSPPETFLTTDEMKWFWDLYIADPARRADPEASPLRARDLSGLPPAIVLTAGYDPLRDEGIAYAERLRAAGVPLTHHHYDDMIHAFFTLVNLLERGDEAVAQVGADIRAALAQPTIPA